MTAIRDDAIGSITLRMEIQTKKKDTKSHSLMTETEESCLLLALHTSGSVIVAI